MKNFKNLKFPLTELSEQVKFKCFACPQTTSPNRDTPTPRTENEVELVRHPPAVDFQIPMQNPGRRNVQLPQLQQQPPPLQQSSLRPDHRRNLSLPKRNSEPVNENNH